MNLRGILYLIVVYIIWGSTYLGIRVAVREGSGFPPFSLATSRVFVAGTILLLWALVARKGVRVNRRELAVLFISGNLLWLGGNGLVTWAEQTAESAYSSLLIASMPLWVAIMEAIIDRHRPTMRLIGALLIGLTGVGVLNGPVILAGSHHDVWAALALLLAAISWGLGTIYQKRKALSSHPDVSAGYQHLSGAVGLLLVAVLSREPAPAPIPEAWAAWCYLIVFGSILGFTSFVKAVRLLPINIVMTYAYVNPLVAVLLGRLILGEPITRWTVGGTVFIILGVMGVFHERRIGAS